MLTLKLTIIAMVFGSGALLMHTENIHTPAVHTGTHIEIVNKEIVPIIPIEKKEEPVSIDQGKAYEQCKREAFERVYEEVNRMLDQIPDRREEQLQLQMMTQ
ncbi:MAG: hypothetical protein Q8O01_05005 [Candidatus Omnitrophota bacterium]|nr:hypothetical protein [Candidatus Omnitrophota bacterium]